MLSRRGQAARVRRRRHRMIAGESEVLVIADGAPTRTGSRWISSRRRSTTSSPSRSSSRRTPRLLDAVRRARATDGQMPRHAIIAASLAHRGALIKVRDLDEACAVAKPRRAGTPGARGGGALAHAAEDSPCRCDLHGTSCFGSARRLLRGTRTMCCRQGRTHAFVALGVYDFQKQLERAHVRLRRRARGAPWPPPWRKAKASWRTRAKRAVSRRARLIMRSVPELVAAVVRPSPRYFAYAIARADGRSSSSDGGSVRLPPEVAAESAPPSPRSSPL